MQEIKIVCKQSNVTISINDKEYLVNTFFSFGCFEDYINVDKDSSLKTYEENGNKHKVINQISLDLEQNVENNDKYDIIKAKLDKINPLEVSPMDALNILYELKKEMNKKD